jgi:hypothetical protein
VRLDRVQALFEAWRELDGVTAPEARAQERALLSAFARDRERFSDIFEASFSIAAAGADLAASGGLEGRADLAARAEPAPLVEHAYRFSYAFPGFRAEIAQAGAQPAAHAASAALAIMGPFGATVTAATRRLLRAATDPAVEQPLVGIAWDRGGAPRHKVYLQFRDGAFGAAALAERVLGIDGLAKRVEGARLHMLGVDLGRDGLTGAKLYVLHPSAGPGDGAFGAALAAALGPIGGGRAIRNALAIHRITQDSAAGTLPPPSDADLGLAENDLVWDDVARAPNLADLLGRSRVAAALLSRFSIGARRLSIGLGAAPRLTVYYGLREVEEP